MNMGRSDLQPPDLDTAILARSGSKPMSARSSRSEGIFSDVVVVANGEWRAGVDIWKRNSSDDGSAGQSTTSWLSAS